MQQVDPPASPASGSAPSVVALVVAVAATVALAALVAWRWWVVRDAPYVPASTPASEALSIGNAWYEQMRGADRAVNIGSVVWVLVIAASIRTMFEDAPTRATWRRVPALAASVVAIAALAAASASDHLLFASAHGSRSLDAFARADAWLLVGLGVIAGAASFAAHRVTRVSARSRAVQSPWEPTSPVRLELEGIDPEAGSSTSARFGDA